MTPDGLTFQHLTRPQSENLYNSLCSVIRTAKFVLVLDNFLSDEDLRWLEGIRSERIAAETTLIALAKRGDQPKRQGRIHFSKAGRASALVEVEASLDQALDSRAWIATDSKTHAAQVHERLMLNQPGKSILCVTSDNKDLPEQAAFLSDPDKISRNYDIVITSPVLTSGVSVTHRDASKFDVVALLARPTVYNAGPLCGLQQLGCVTYEAKDLIVGIDHVEFESVAEEALIKEAKSVLAGTETSETLDMTDTASFNTNHVKAKSSEAFARRHYLPIFTRAAEHEGYQFDIVTQPMVGAEEISEFLNDIRAIIKKNRDDGLLRAGWMTREEIEAHLIERVGHLYDGKLPKSAEIVVLENAARTRKKLGFAPDSTLMEEDIKAYDTGIGPYVDRFGGLLGCSTEEDFDEAPLASRKLKLMHKLIAEITEGVNVFGLLSAPVLKAMAERAWARKDALIACGLLPTEYRTKRSFKYPKILIGNLFASMGLKWETASRKDGKERLVERSVSRKSLMNCDVAFEGGVFDLQGDSVKAYKLCPDSVAAMELLLARQQIARNTRKHKETQEHAERLAKRHEYALRSGLREKAKAIDADLAETLTEFNRLNHVDFAVTPALEPTELTPLFEAGIGHTRDETLDPAKVLHLDVNHDLSRFFELFALAKVEPGPIEKYKYQALIDGLRACPLVTRRCLGIDSKQVPDDQDLVARVLEACGWQLMASSSYNAAAAIPTHVISRANSIAKVDLETEDLGIDRMIADLERAQSPFRLHLTKNERAALSERILAVIAKLPVPETEQTSDFSTSLRRFFEAVKHCADTSGYMTSEEVSDHHQFMDHAMETLTCDSEAFDILHEIHRTVHGSQAFSQIDLDALLEASKLSPLAQKMKELMTSPFTEAQKESSHLAFNWFSDLADEVNVSINEALGKATD